MRKETAFLIPSSTLYPSSHWLSFKIKNGEWMGGWMGSKTQWIDWEPKGATPMPPPNKALLRDY